jgi:hypothetical protein
MSVHSIDVTGIARSSANHNEGIDQRESARDRPRDVNGVARNSRRDIERRYWRPFARKPNGR